METAIYVRLTFPYLHLCGVEWIVGHYYRTDVRELENAIDMPSDVLGLEKIADLAEVCPRRIYSKR
jgi:hypothetical protein